MEPLDLDLGGGWRLRWSPEEPGRIFLRTENPLFVPPADSNAGPGLWLTFDTNPASANYHPQYFNRAVRAFALMDMFGPEVVEEKPRHLNQRSEVIRDARRSGAPIVLVDGVLYVPKR